MGLALKGVVSIQGKPDAEIAALLKEHGFNITTGEALRVTELLGRDATVVELTIFNTMWSEHCSYKSSRGVLKEFLPTEAPNVVLGPGEDSGIIRFAPAENGDHWCLVISHESHNHPSQVLPVEGAATGIGGIVRDVYCMGADVVGSLDPLRFGDPAGPKGRQAIAIARGVIEGIAQYGNALGVPNLGGDVVFDRGYDDNCLVNVVAVGIVKESRVIRSRVPVEARKTPYKMILIGKPTDDSGFGGAAFASEDLASEEKANRGAVQVPDPFLKRVLSEAMKKVFEAAANRGVAIGFKDLGAGGIACATSELAHAGGFGVKIDLDKVNLAMGKYPSAVISCSETQERFAMAVPADFAAEVLRIFNEDFDLPHIYHGAGAFVIGDITLEPDYTIETAGSVVCSAPVDVITTGIKYDRKGAPRRRLFAEPKLDPKRSIRDDFLKIIGSPNGASKNYVYRRYDAEVQGRAVLRPGEADASVIAPIAGRMTGLAFSVDGNPFYGLIDPYQGGALGVCEAARNVAAVGGVPATITDCLNYGNPEVEEVFWEFSEGVRGIGDACRGIGHLAHEGSPLPVVSGNVSFYNQSESGKSIPPSPVLCCVGVVEDYSKCRSIQFKEEGDTLYLLGDILDELGGSEYYRVVYGASGANVPKADFLRERRLIRTVVEMHALGWVRACHDVSQGGLLTALAEMAIGGRGAGDLGFTLDLEGLANFKLPPEKLLFSETGCFVVELAPGPAEREILGVCARNRVNLTRLGELSGRARIEIVQRRTSLAAWDVAELRKAHLSGCRPIFGIGKGGERA
jgi:phosphoribosylformylglycinamidine synthase subunit PurL